MNSKEITLRMPQDIYEALSRMKEETGISIANLVILAVLNRMSNPTSTAPSSGTGST